MDAEFTTTDGVPIKYCLRGSGSPIYVCHGGPFGAYELFAPDLAPLEEDFTLVFHDYRGSGRSGAASSETYNFDHLAADLDQLRAHLGHKRIDVLAHSMGVWIALTFALGHPGSTRRLVLVGGSPTSPRLMPLSMTRALGPLRLAKVWAQGLTFVFIWSWRASSSGAHKALVKISANDPGRPPSISKHDRQSSDF